MFAVRRLPFLFPETQKKEESTKKKEEQDSHIDNDVSCVGAHLLCAALSRQRLLNPIKLAYE